MSEAPVLWRRLDTPGHDACWLAAIGEYRELHGAALYLQGAAPVALEYRLVCDAGWVAQTGSARGCAGESTVDLTFRRDASGVWMANGVVASPGLRADDLDFGFTPATNTATLLRLALAVGEGAAVTSAWLDIDRGVIEPLTQRYERRGEDTYRYEASRFEYETTLTVSPSGFVVEYPGLWRAEA